MRQTINQLQAVALVVALLFGVGRAAGAETPGESPYAASIVIEAETGQVLQQENADREWAPASLVKMMLTLLVMEQVDRGEASLTMPIRVSANASRIGGSQVYLKEGEVFSLGELMQAIEIASANDACVAVAEGLVGSTDAMVVLMNEKAQQLGMTRTRYVNVHGLPADPGEPENVTTARDAAILARELIRKHPEVLKWTSTIRAPFRNGKFILYSTNQEFLRRFPGADGLKTGYHSEAGYNLVGTATRKGVRLISVVLGTPSARARTDETIRLLSTTFVTHERRTVLRSGEMLPDRVYVEGSEHQYIPLRAADDLTIYAARRDFDAIRLVPEDVPRLEAPVKEGQPAGRLVAKLNEQVLGSVPLVTAQNVQPATLLWRIWNWRTRRPTEGRFLRVEARGDRAPLAGPPQ